MDEKKAKYIASIIEIGILFILAITIISHLIFIRYTPHINVDTKYKDNKVLKTYIINRKNKVVKNILKGEIN